MSALAGLWIASLFGAALFLAAGYLAATMRRRSLAYADADAVLPLMSVADPSNDDRLAAAIVERDAARAETAGARREVLELREAVGTHEKQRAAADAKARAAEESDRLLKKATGESERWRDEARSLSAKVADLANRLEESTRRAAAADALGHVEAERKDLTTRVGVLEGRLRDAEHLREENASLRAALRDRALLEERLRVAENQLSAPSARAKQSSPSVKPPAVDGSGRQSLRRILASLTSHPGVRAALFADDLGFPVEASGEHAESLAALSGVLSAAAVKTRQLLPVGPAARIVVVDDHDVTVTARRHATDWGPLALVTLSEGPSPDVESLPFPARETSAPETQSESKAPNAER